MEDKTKRKFVTSQMFDVRPTNDLGDLDLEKIESVQKIIRIKPKRYFPKSNKEIGEVFYDLRKPNMAEEEARRFERIIAEEKKETSIYSPISISHSDCDDQKREIKVELSMPISKTTREEEEKKEEDLPILLNDYHEKEGFDYFEKFAVQEQEKEKREKKKLPQNIDFSSRMRYLKNLVMPWKEFSKITVFFLAILIIFFSVNLFGKGWKIKNEALGEGKAAYGSLLAGKKSLTSHNFEKASFEFSEAYEKFDSLSRDINDLGVIVVAASKYLPFTSKLSSGSHLASAGKNISQVGIKVSDTLNALDKVKKDATADSGSISLLDIFQKTASNIKEISVLMIDLEKNLDEVNVEDIPEEQREKFVILKKKLPEVNEFLVEFMDDSRVFADILGSNGPRKYLFLFQNNQEMRATGGFIGTYGVLSIFNGHVQKFFVDGIFNPDGQLREKVIPPAPIQKISATWSLHDSNWFPDFPVSAEKASWFYEKTGGPTVDGIITMTPTVMQKMLEITGPIEMPEYGVTIDKDNFIEKVQQEVEVDYDKEMNQPKKILSDLAPLILDKIFNAGDMGKSAKVLQVMADSLNEKQILIYSKNYEVEKILSRRGWSGEILDTSKDYLSVINTNINGFKTDGVIDEKINHEAEIQDDGNIVDTVTITRTHNGGDSKFEWWNKVNADYMRVYVPKGSKLLSVSGQTREFNSPPLDYRALGFKKDPQVEMEESQIETDGESGTRIYEDAGKTVFANWVYVSPKETVEIKYSYLLPFKIDINQKEKTTDTFSVLFQKQSGSIGSRLVSQIIYPSAYDIFWKYPENNVDNVDNLADENKGIRMEDSLETDKFIGVAFGKK